VRNSSSFARVPKPEQPPQFGPAQMPERVFFERQRFERVAL
jgi:hypothetical protein